MVYFAMYYSVKYLASTSCNSVSINFFLHQPGYLLLDCNLGEVDSNQHQVLDRFSVVLASSQRSFIRCVHAVIVVASLLCDYGVHLCAWYKDSAVAAATWIGEVLLTGKLPPTCERFIQIIMSICTTIEDIAWTVHKNAFFKMIYPPLPGNGARAN